MFERELRSAVQHFDYDSAMRIWNKVNSAELHQRYQVTDAEDSLYWELDALIVAHEDNGGDKAPLAQRGDVVRIYD